MEDNQQILKEYLEYRQLINREEGKRELDYYAVTELMKYTKNKSLMDITEKDTQDFIRNQKTMGTRTTYGAHLISFFRWLHKLDKRERPQCMKWFEFPTADLIAKNKDPDVKKYLITDEEYKKLQQNIRHDMKWSALFETIYLCGGRPDEVNNMTVGDVEEDDDGKVIVTLMKSKTIPRRIPLPNIPLRLKNWLTAHPLKDDKTAILFPSGHHGKFSRQMATTAINDKLNLIKKQTGIKSTISPKSFRKTRATIMFSSRNPTYDDTEIGKFFGWKPHTVIMRRQEYDLRDFDDLKNKIQGNIQNGETFDIVKQERDTLIKKQAGQIQHLQEELKYMKIVLEKFAEREESIEAERKVIK